MEYSILKDIVIIFALSTIVNFIFTKIKVPTIIGYLITGIIAGPHLLAIIKTPHEIDLMAEIGVILLMFTIGLEFSLNHLMKIRKIVFFGGFMQLLVTVAIIACCTHFFDIVWQSGIFIGFLVALSSTAVVLKILQERGELTSNYGQTVLGILIFQDIILIPLMLFAPMLGGQVVNVSDQLLWLLIKTIGIIAFVYVGNKWLMPKMLQLIAFTKNQELFFMSILLICLSVALMTASLGMSLAFGAFLGGLMISESEYSHNAFGNLIPFKDTFTSFFFVSIGMLLDTQFVIDNYQMVLLTVLVVIVIKAFTAGTTAFFLGHTFRGTILVGIALSQVGEFSFILAKLGLDYKILSSYTYQLFLAVTIITMSVSPFIIKMAKPISELILKLPLPKVLINGLFPLQQIDIPEMKNHLVLIGKDSRSMNLATMSKRLKIPYVSIIFDPVTVRKLQQKGESVVYGDAVNDPILHKAHTATAEIVVVSIGDIITSMAVIEKVRRINKHAYILVRSKYVHNIDMLYKVGADQVIPEEFETAIELFERVLKKYLYPQREIENTIAKIRSDKYGFFNEKSKKQKRTILSEMPNIDISALKVSDYPIMHNKTILEMKFRNIYGVTLVAIKRGEEIIEHPDTDIQLLKNDIAYIMGKPEQLTKAIGMFAAPTSK